MGDLLLPLSLTLGPPLLLAIATAFARPRSLLDWLLFALLCGSVAVYMYLASPVWFWIGSGWRILPLGIALVAILWSARLLRLRRPRLRLSPARPRARAGIAFRGAVTALVAGMLVDLHLAGIAPAGAVDLPFPLDDGHFAILQGGGSAALNHHRAVPAQAYAVDIVALNDQGRRARGIRPEALDAYEIFDRPVIAPCDGIVSEASDEAPDEPIGERDKEPLRPAGNHVLLFCISDGAGISLLFAHFRSGSVAVARGDRVRSGALLGRVGNSGNSTEPHLHFHAVRGRAVNPETALATAEAVPLTFDGRFPTRNTIVRIPGSR